MSHQMHFNLLKPEELLTSRPVRWRIMLPLLMVLTLVGLCTWWGVLFFKLSALQHKQDVLAIQIANQKPKIRQVLDLRSEERANTAALKQLTLYRQNQIHFGALLLQLPHSVPPDIQLTELSLPLHPGHLQTGSTATTQTTEKLTLTLAGRVGGQHSSEVVSQLLQELRSPHYQPLIVSVYIPEGAFRLDTARAARTGISLFGIHCDCGSRRFE